MSVDVKEMLTRQRKRTTGAILGYAEEQAWYTGLPRPARDAFREKVLASMSSYHDVVSDLVATLDGGGGIHNDAALLLLQQIHGLLSPARERALADGSGHGRPG